MVVAAAVLLHAAESDASMCCQQACRECCGGMGFLAANRIGPLKNDMDVDVTFEGANPVMMQQVCRLMAALASSLLMRLSPCRYCYVCTGCTDFSCVPSSFRHTLAGGQGAAGLGATGAAAPLAGGVAAFGCAAGGLQSAAPLQVSISASQACTSLWRPHHGALACPQMLPAATVN